MRLILTLMKNWWLLALCGVLDAILAFMNLSMQSPEGYRAWRMFSPASTGMDMCKLAMAAGVCTIAAGICSSRKGRSWLLVLNGLAFIAYGLIPILWKGPLQFRSFALPLLIVMAMSIGIFELATAHTLRRQVADKWFLGLAGAGLVGFALAFLVMWLRWIKLEPGPQWLGFLWLGAYFGFSAICMLGLALRPRSLDPSSSGPWEALPENPKHAH